jgi:FMN phosphatase YigB (HAD superfamily)
MPAAEALLFDLGGVIVELDWDRAFAHWARCAAVPVAPIRERFSFDEPYQRHERGEIDARTYYSSLRRSLGIDIPDDDFESGWNAIFAREISATTQLVKALRGRVPLYLFSNTNAAHHRAWATRFATALEPFDRVFISSAIGLRKPSRAAFAHVAREMGMPLGKILFLDDTLENVVGARAAGMQAAHVRTPGEVRAAVQPWLARP